VAATQPIKILFNLFMIAPCKKSEKIVRDLKVVRN